MNLITLKALKSPISRAFLRQRENPDASQSHMTVFAGLPLINSHKLNQNQKGWECLCRCSQLRKFKLDSVQDNKRMGYSLFSLMFEIKTAFFFIAILAL